jgi:hypothetical protein
MEDVEEEVEHIVYRRINVFQSTSVAKMAESLFVN